MEPFFEEQPDNFNLIYDLALTNRGVGNKNAALALEQAIAVIPVEKDAFDGPAPIEILARISRFMSLTATNGPTTLSRMNKLCILPTFVISLLLLALTPGLRAQTAQGMENAEKVAQELKLTPQQEAKVLPILKQEAPKIEEIKNNPSLSGIQKMRQLRAIHSETAPQLQQILSPEQYQKLQAIREERIKEAMAKKSAGG